MKIPLIAAGLIALLALARPGSSASEPTMADSTAVEADASDAFPFARNEVPEKYPSVWFALGAGGYLSSFASAERAFHAIEDFHRAQGFPVPSAGDIRPRPMLVPAVVVRLHSRIEARFQAGRTADAPTEKVTVMGGLLSGRVPLSPGGKVSLFGGLGGGTCRFSFKRDYGVRVTDYDGNRGYYELESITLEGGGGYWTAGGGLTVRAFPRGAIEAQIQYVGTGDVSTGATGAGEVRVNMSGAMIALSIIGML